MSVTGMRACNYYFIVSLKSASVVWTSDSLQRSGASPQTVVIRLTLKHHQLMREPPLPLPSRVVPSLLSSYTFLLSCGTRPSSLCISPHGSATLRRDRSPRWPPARAGATEVNAPKQSKVTTCHSQNGHVNSRSPRRERHAIPTSRRRFHAL